MVNLGISFGVATLVLLLTYDVLFEFIPLKRVDLSLIDLRFKHRGANTKIRDSSKVIIVEISQESFKRSEERRVGKECRL